MPTIVVEVMPKAELLDPQGKAVAGALTRLGNTDITGVRVGKRFELTTAGPVDDATLEQVRGVAVDLLSNSVIEDVVGVSVVDGPTVSTESAPTETVAP
ncbi:phosphoribosylformylglycinamidine synthase subunit PurS [Labedella phragmitis]|uniref:Phosphoribosylformylglycinamidine synthase subunit PurS n=1 Tax=Labedella phragmitis TaxID=2498849 RepID=A0A3S3ZBL1_9MICO|nr:phosphoribosylformylglycinamidine synthase subunit PurS [Labedella phragmitis]RWZ53147.1 phosphoribosylformylglycinamidine synthase subunit PurS [Labedella phragmitis]